MSEARQDLLQKEWERFKEATDFSGANESITFAFERVFYAGCQAVLLAVDDLLDPQLTARQSYDQLESMRSEMDRFIERCQALESHCLTKKEG